MRRSAMLQVAGILAIATMQGCLLSACRQPSPPAAPQPEIATDGRAEERNRMVDSTIVARGVSDPEVLRAMRSVPRHLFVPEEYQDQAYEDHPLPIGYGQTISQPFIVALMTEALELEPDDKVLEIGTGSGYQAAVLAEIVEYVYSIEIVGALAERASQTLVSAGYDNVEILHADGYFGWEENAPFDAIIVTAAPDHIPPPLMAQLADGGRMVIPVGPPGGYQELWLVERAGDRFTTTSLGGVSFVPLTREVRDE
jgi:protein-L-isoaspartate(D-aspartate) O-methyltransferase